MPYEAYSEYRQANCFYKNKQDSIVNDGHSGLHNLAGPAVVGTGKMKGYVAYYIDGKRVTQEEHKYLSKKYPQNG